MEKFAQYLAAIDGKNDWSSVQPLFDDVFHPDCLVVTADGEMNKEQWAEMAEGLVAKGAIASDFEVTAQEGDSIYYQLTITVGEDEPLHMRSKGTLKEGRLSRVEPVDPDKYSAMVERSR